MEILIHVWDWIKSWMLSSGRGNTPEGNLTSDHQLCCESSCSLGDKAGESTTETSTTSLEPSAQSSLAPPISEDNQREHVSNAGRWNHWCDSNTSYTSLNTPQRCIMQRYDTCFFMDVFWVYNPIRTVISFLGMKNPRPSEVSGLGRLKSTSQHHSPQGSCLNTLCFLPHMEGYYFPPKFLVVWLFLNIWGPHWCIQLPSSKAELAPPMARVVKNLPAVQETRKVQLQSLGQ